MITNYLKALIIAATLGVSNYAMAVNCYIFVHGRQTDTGTATNYTVARNYWRGENTDAFMIKWGNYSDGVQKITKGFAHKYYVVGYDAATKAYFDGAVDAATQINNALAGGADKGGASCAGASKYVLVVHSMGGAVVDFILGNSRSTDPNYNYKGANFANISSKISYVYSIEGAHRGTKAADAACGSADMISNTLAKFVSPCTASTTWLQTASNYQVSGYMNAPTKPVYLFAGHEAMADSFLLPGEDDGVLSHASTFACLGDPNASYGNSNVCTSKMKTANYFNRSSAHENHSDATNGSDTDRRIKVASGLTCKTSTCFSSSDLWAGLCSNTPDEVSCFEGP